MLEWLSDNKIPLGKWIEQFINLLSTNVAWLFDGISAVLGFMIDGLVDILMWLNPLILILLIAVAAWWLHRSWRLCLGIVASLLLIINLGYWEATMETLALVLYATLMCMVVGVPIGIAAAHRPWLYSAIRPVLDLMQTLPTFVYLIPTLFLFGLGVVPGLISTVIFAIPAPIRLTYLGISGVPDPLREAGEAFGARKAQLLWKVELPYALPTIMAGLTQCIMLSLSMVVIAALVGASGLGVPVLRALSSLNIAMGFEAGLTIVIIAILLDRLLKQPAKTASKR